MATEGGKGEISDTEGPEVTVKKATKVEQPPLGKRKKPNNTNNYNTSIDFTVTGNWIRGLRVRVQSQELVDHMKRVCFSRQNFPANFFLVGKYDWNPAKS
jgi:hypothetical protein